MCGILGMVSLAGEIRAKELAASSAIIKHRGPDDEGFLMYNLEGHPTVYAGKDTADVTQKHWNYQRLQPDATCKVAFGHRRLSIVDLSPSGHQPMLFGEASLAISFNGEVYNYVEIRDELKALGHIFKSSGDTEVILHAWAEWGVDCLRKFNGMFAFLLLDYSNKKLYAVRDRFGVKPLYYYQKDDLVILASEIKQIKISETFIPQPNDKIAAAFLGHGMNDHTNETFDKQIFAVPPGHYLYFDLSLPETRLQVKQWYKLVPSVWKGSYKDAVKHFRELLTDAVKLRLRADVAIGSCLSGGLDSSSIVCIAADLLKEQGDYVGQETVTACYEDLKYDEWKYAQEVVNKTGVHPNKVFTSFSDLISEFDTFMWYQDEPTGSTSTYSQWAVFKKSHQQGLKVMIDGQGADEQLAGYGGNDLPLYAGLMRRARLLSLLREAQSYKEMKGQLPIGFLIGAAQLTFGPAFSKFLPAAWRLDHNTEAIQWLSPAYAASYYTTPAVSLQDNLFRQVHTMPLPSLLRYEDRNSMAWSVESRTPFMDYRLFEFTLGLPESYVYKDGVTKTILREAMVDILPKAISERKDKMGFVTPEEVWLKGEGKPWFMDWTNYVADHAPTYVNGKKLKQEVEAIIAGEQPFSFLPWRVAVLGNWLYTLSAKAFTCATSTN